MNEKLLFKIGVKFAALLNMGRTFEKYCVKLGANKVIVKIKYEARAN